MELVEIIRDIVIIVYGILGIVAVIAFIVVMLFLYRKVSPILDSAKATMNEVRGTAGFVSENAVKPIIKTASFAMGARRTAESLGRLFRKGGTK